MSMMNPDLESEFREEADFRAKVYRMLSLGLSTVEIENLLGCKINWSLFSQDTLEKLLAKENEVKLAISLPPEYFSNLDAIKTHFDAQTDYFCQSIHALVDFAKRSEAGLAEFKESVINIIAGFCVIFGIIVIAIFGILLAIK